MSVQVDVEDPAKLEIRTLLEEGERYAAALYPVESNHFLSVEDLRAANVHFVVARDTDGSVFGTGALVLNRGWAEIKRMWVVPAARGRGISKAILAALEGKARTAGISVVRLETGVSNLEALALYRRSGFEVCDAFEGYKPDPFSVFMQKKIGK